MAKSYRTTNAQNPTEVRRALQDTDRRLTSLEGGSTAVVTATTAANSALAVAQSNARWRVLPASNHSTAVTSTNTIATTIDLSTDLPVGTPLKITFDGGTRYGFVRTISSSQFTWAGEPKPVSDTITQIEYGVPELMLAFDSRDAGNYGTATGDIGWHFIWNHKDAHFVGVAVCHETGDGGLGSDPKVNLQIGGNALITDDSGNGVQVSTAWVRNADVGIDITYSTISFGDEWTFEVTVTDTLGNSDTFRGIALFVLE